MGFAPTADISSHMRYALTGNHTSNVSVLSSLRVAGHGMLKQGQFHDSEMAEFAIKAENLSPRSHMVEGEKRHIVL